MKFGFGPNKKNHKRSETRQLGDVMHHTYNMETDDVTVDI